MSNIIIKKESKSIGVDWAKWNKPHYKKSKEDGISFAILKVINMSCLQDSMFETHVNGCLNAGIEIKGGYTYSYANTIEKAKKAANQFVKFAKPKGIDTMYLDLEDRCMMGLGHLIVDIIYVYKSIAEAAGMKFAIYTGASFYNPYLRPYKDELSGISWWWARYPKGNKEFIPTDDIPNTKYLPTDLEIDGWQYTSKGKLSGSTGYHDFNIWYNNGKKNLSIEELLESNPYEEPLYTISLGSMGEGACWVNWYLWKFGLLTNSNGYADPALINSSIDSRRFELIKTAQSLVGFVGNEIDGKVGKATRARWKKIC